MGVPETPRRAVEMSVRIDSESRRSQAVRTVVAMAIGAGVFAGCESDRSAERAIELRDRRQSLLATFASVTNQLRPSQAAALDAPRVQAAQAEFYSVLRARMIQIDPESEAMLDRATGVGSELEDATQNVAISPNDTVATLEEKAAIAAEFRALEQSLVPAQTEAMKYPEVAAAFRALQDSVVAEIRLIDPDADVLLNQMRQIEEEMVEIDRELAELDN